MMIKIRTILKRVPGRPSLLIAAGCLATLLLVGSWLLVSQPWNHAVERAQPAAAETIKAETPQTTAAAPKPPAEEPQITQPVPSSPGPRQAAAQPVAPVRTPPAPITPSISATPLIFKDESDVLCALTTETTLTSNVGTLLQVFFHFKKVDSGAIETMVQHVYLPANTPTKVIQFANFIEPVIYSLEVSVSISNKSAQFVAPAPFVTSCS
jgi:hypothetical protein